MEGMVLLEPEMKRAMTRPKMLRMPDMMTGMRAGITVLGLTTPMAAMEEPDFAVP